MVLQVQGKKNPQEWAQSAWAALSLTNQKLVKDGKAIESDQDNLKELVLRAEAFESKRLPILKALKVV